MDAIVIGGGLAGLAAATRLVDAGRSVTLVEARDRLGGRVWSAPYDDMAVELGPEWLDGNGALGKLVRESGGHVTESEGEYLERGPSGWKPSRQAEVVRRLVKRLLRRSDPDLSLIEALHQSGRGEDLAAARQYLLPYVEGFHAADPLRLSSRWLMEVEDNQSADASEGHTHEGLSRVIDLLAQRLEGRATVKLSAPVKRVRWRGGHVDLDLEVGTLSARCAVITVPLGVLQSGDFEFIPPVAAHATALTQMAMGQVHKLVIAFDHAPWDGRIPEHTRFLHDAALGFPTWWFPGDDEQPVIVGWVGGPQAEQLSGMDSRRVVGLALDSLARLLELDRKDVEAGVTSVWYHDWNRDPFTRGAYTYVVAGGLGAPDILGRPVENTLFFAGEATCAHGYNATMDGALSSGVRAAEEILSHVHR